MSLAQGNNIPTRPRIEPGSPDPESNALTTRPVRSPIFGLNTDGFVYFFFLLNFRRRNHIIKASAAPDNIRTPIIDGTQYLKLSLES